MPISKLTFIRSTVLAILVGAAALVAIVAMDYWLVGRTRAYAETVTAARVVRSTVVELRNLMDDAETGQRGYLLAEDERYLAPYTEARRRIPQQIGQLAAVVRSDPALAAAVARLATVLDGKLAELDATVEAMRSGHRAAALAIIKTDRGRELMDEARGLFGRILDSAENRIQVAVQDQNDAMRALQWATVAGALVIFLVVGGSVWTVLLYTRQLIASQREVQDLNVTLEERVRDRTADLGRANEEIQRFAYVVTHDLRAPLVNIMGFTSELEGALAAIQEHLRNVDAASEQPAVKEARAAALEDLPEAIGFIRASSRKMDGLINAILKLSREGRRVLKPEPIRLDALLENAAASVQHQVIESGGALTIDSHVAPLVSDRLALEQIFGNLLDNAVKYRSPERPLQIRVRAREDGRQRIVVEVEDNGRGIAAQDHERVFDLFRRSGAQDQAGEGIGLAHVRTMVRNLGGEITLASELARGTTMKLSLPRDLRRVATQLDKGAA